MRWMLLRTLSGVWFMWAHVTMDNDDVMSRVGMFLFFPRFSTVISAVSNERNRSKRILIEVSAK